jgi:transposase
MKNNTQMQVSNGALSSDRTWREWREGRRLRAWELHKEGWSQVRIAEALGVSRGAVSKWFKAATTDGPQALLRRFAPGGVSRLNQEQLLQLDGWLRQEGGASAFGFVGEVWTRPRVARLIEGRFGVKYHPSQVGRILRKMGFSPQKPVKQARQRDEASVERWINEEWPALKKSG